MYIYIFIYVYIYIHIYTYVYTYICKFICIYIYTYMYIYIYIPICTNVNTYVKTYIYVLYQGGSGKRARIHNPCDICCRQWRPDQIHAPVGTDRQLYPMGVSWRDSFIRVTWLISYAWVDSFQLTWLVPTCDVIQSYVWKWPCRNESAVAPCVCRDPCARVAWSIYMCDVIGS